jgi:hypothetical protein
MFPSVTGGFRRGEVVVFASSTRKPPKQEFAPIPKVGEVFALDHTYVVQEERDGKQCTPMTKLRHTNNGWQLVGRNQSGIHIFLTDEPKMTDKHFVITSIVPGGRAAYASPQP